MILHAPLALIAGLFAGTLLWVTPQGGLETPPLGIVSDAAQGATSWSAAPNQFAYFD